MSTKAELARLTEEVIRDLGLKYAIVDITQVADTAYTWRIVLSNDAASREERPFDLTIEWPDDAEAVKADMEICLSAAVQYSPRA